MARGVVFQIQGMRGLEAALEKASESVRKRVGEANRDTAFAIQAAARATLQAHKQQGHLIANIAVQGKGLVWRVGILDTSFPSRGGTNSAHLNPFVYGTFLEYGFKSFGELRFMRDAVEKEEPKHDIRIHDAGLKIGQDVATAA